MHSGQAQSGEHARRTHNNHTLRLDSMYMVSGKDGGRRTVYSGALVHSLVILIEWVLSSLHHHRLAAEAVTRAAVVVAGAVGLTLMNACMNMRTV